MADAGDPLDVPLPHDAAPLHGRGEDRPQVEEGEQLGGVRAAAGGAGGHPAADAQAACRRRRLAQVRLQLPLHAAVAQDRQVSTHS